MSGGAHECTHFEATLCSHALFILLISKTTYVSLVVLQVLKVSQ